MSAPNKSAIEREKKIWDISPLLDKKTAVWPGDQPFVTQKSLRIQDGHNIDLGSMTTTFHLGAHADAPSHYAAKGVAIEAVDLIPYLGRCQVVDVSHVGLGKRVFPKDLGVPVTAPRVILKTGTFPDPNYFSTDFASLSSELIDFLATKSVVLVGIDTPSVDLFDDKILETHQALMKHGMRNLEGLVLSLVPPAEYELIALPLKIRDGDASPVRAILRTL